MISYSAFLVRFYWLVLLLTTVVAAVFIAVAFTTKDLPNLNDPVKGFKSRGTKIKGRQDAVTNLDDSAEVSYSIGSLATGDPQTFSNGKRKKRAVPQSFSDRKKRAVPQSFSDRKKRAVPQSFSDRKKRAVPQSFSDRKKRAVPQSFSDRKKRAVPQSCYDRLISQYLFQSQYSTDLYFKIVFKSTSGATLWSLDAIKEMCAMDKRLVLDSSFAADNGCPSHSVGYYIGSIRNKDCDELDDDDLSSTIQVLKSCVGYYYDAWDQNDDLFYQSAPSPCQDIAIYNILHFLTDSDFLGRNSRDNEKLTNAAMFLDLNYQAFDWNAIKSTNVDFYLDEIHGVDLTGSDVEVTAVDTTERFDIFTHFLLREMALFILGMAWIFIIMGLYLRSALITVFTLLDVIFSFGIAYFLYMVVFNIPHMPFLGVLTLLLLIAIGADDVFIFCDSFEQARAEHPDKDLTFWISETMHHAALSILVTSLTTGAALFANIVSDITDIKGFGIISGTSIVINYLLMVTWIPSAVIAIEKINNYCCAKVKCCDCFEKFAATVKEYSETIFQKFLPACVSKAWFVWLILFLGLGIGGIVVTFVTPKLDLPTSEDFALFKRDSIMEVWTQELKFKFRYYQKENDQKLGGGMWLVAVWGVDDKDTGNYLDPDSRGDLKFDSSFDLSQPAAQTWIKDFCHDLINASFVDPESTRGRTCSIDVFNSYVTGSCSRLQTVAGSYWDSSFSDCCEQPSVPVQSDVFTKCYYLFTILLSSDPNNVYTHLGAAFYSASSVDMNMKAYTFDFRSTQGYTANYQIMDEFYKKIQSWMDSKLDSAPSGVSDGWLQSRYENFELYDLQSSLASGTYEAIGVSMAAAFVVMLVTSLNVLITFYAIFTIFLTISVCAGILVLLGWELNIVESVTLTMSVGLSIDFCIHYGMGYRLSELVDRKLRVQESFRKVAAAIFMAAGTTFIAGACIMPATILFYVQLGSFFMIVMTFSWLFATFFFQSLCYVIGPNGSFAQIPSPLLLCKKKEDDKGSPNKVNPGDEMNLSNGTENWTLKNGTQPDRMDAEGTGSGETRIEHEGAKKEELSPKKTNNEQYLTKSFTELGNEKSTLGCDWGIQNPAFHGSQASLRDAEQTNGHSFHYKV